MVWLMVALILGSLGFTASTFMRYKAYLDEVQPKLNHARKAAERLEKGVEVETRRKHEDEEKREAVKKQISEKKSKIAEVKRKIVEAEKVQEELEMAKYKQDFKKQK